MASHAVDHVLDTPDRVVAPEYELQPNVPINVVSGGQAKTLMFVHISPEPDADGETISTVKFAEQFPKVELGAARVNKDSANAKELKEQIGTLKAALARKEENQRTCNIHFPTVLKDREQKPVSYRLKVKWTLGII
uniref:Kinesin motor domain-containing protein n=1 Tax=Vitis vinifera TaxID=29760 RepID=F6HBY2_VITVI